MAAPMAELPVEPQVTQARPRPLFTSHGTSFPLDTQSKRIRVSYKVTAEYGGFKNLPSEHTTDKSKHKTEQASNPLALPGIPEAKGSKKEGGQGSLVMAPLMLPKAPACG